ncbi:MAG: cupin domain-containing protein [Ignavibacteria bacterium]|nr:cupin domain-containing protein [Ignavibacteria bacterium]
MKIEVKKLSEEEITQMGIRTWAIWTKEISKFDWFYDSKEMCLFLEGKVIVEANNTKIEIKKGDFVTFPKGLSCVWNVLEPVKKHYLFE